MLEAKELVKIYKPKKGVPVTALDHINIKFPDKGMVFLLGKSGSGKSTLLNVLGGLDKYDSGEIVIKGVSSKDFKQQHFDSYRNTYVGFIFQEYNVLDDFNVGANIALAIELQGRKATDEEINRILCEVDLEGFGSRKPNELSGGQKQRVAIARALVKNPEIIMADEPTGALDSNTGRQVFDTLKKLSENKLVIVVSHDREFAERYADRIVELSDGKIINDVTVDSESQEETENSTVLYDGNTVKIPFGYHLTDEDRIAINEYIDKITSGNVELSVGENKKLFRFIKTDESKIVNVNSGFKLIKSRLPLKNAFKIGASGLKHKKIRLVITIILSCIAFGLFGLSDTFGAYNHIKTCTNSIYDTGIDYASVKKSHKCKNGAEEYWNDYGSAISEKDIRELKENTGLNFRGVFLPKGKDFSFFQNINTTIELSKTEYSIYIPQFNGFTEIDQSVIDELGYKILAGNLPDGTKDEIAVSKYIFEVFNRASYYDGVSTVKNSKGDLVPDYKTIEKYDDLIGKGIDINGKKYTVVCIVDTGFDLERYVPLTEEKANKSSAQQILDFALYSEFCSAQSYSYASCAMVGKGSIKEMLKSEPPIFNTSRGYLWLYGEDSNVDPAYLTTFDLIDTKDVVWLDGEKTSLGDKELIVTENVFYYNREDDSDLSENSRGFKNSLKLYGKINSNGKDVEEDGYKIVGIIPNNEKTANIQGALVTSERVFNLFSDKNEGDYTFALGLMPKEKKDIKTLVSYCYSEGSDISFPLQNSVTFELDSLNSSIKLLAKYFLYIGLGFALFAALMLANFIATSISYKKQEIGILRAIGSRGNDVFRIFFSESFIIAMINFVLSSAGVFTVTCILNNIVRNEAGILITVLNFGIRQVILLLAVSILVAALASFIPVKRIASKLPIDAIRDR